MGRTLAISKRLDLDSIEGWEGKGCFVNMTPISFGELSSLSGLDKMDDDKALETLTNLLKKHFAFGKVLVYKEGTSTEELDDATADDLAALPVTTLEALFTTLTGEDFSDPKGSAKTASPSSSPTATSTDAPSGSENASETQSSPEKPAA